ncbi:MAG TPA: ATP synthase F1 subunit delta [Bacteroidales bacterium]|nr:ATP synthase F1 subunit delta [Bacteroidales bacterium]
MNDSKISVRYSKALFRTALEKDIIDKVMADMAFILEINKAPETREFLENPVIVPSKKATVLNKLLKGSVQDVTLSLVDLLVKNGRESFLPAIARAFVHETRVHRGITETVLTTAVPVDENVRKDITKLVADTFKTRVELKEVIDPSIIGGFILRVDDNYIDASIKNKLRKVKKELLGNNKSR